MINIFENDTVYGNGFSVVERRNFNDAELNMINTGLPGIVFLGEKGLGVKLFVKGSINNFFYRELDEGSCIKEGEIFIVSKALLTIYKSDVPGVEVQKIYVPKEAVF